MDRSVNYLCQFSNFQASVPCNFCSIALPFKDLNSKSTELIQDPLILLQLAIYHIVCTCVLILYGGQTSEIRFLKLEKFHFPFGTDELTDTAALSANPFLTFDGVKVSSS